MKENIENHGTQKQISWTVALKRQPRNVPGNTFLGKTERYKHFCKEKK